MKIINTLLLAAICGTALAQVGFDPTFGNNGYVITNFGGRIENCQVMRQSGGQLLLAGPVIDYGSTEPTFQIVRYLPDGNIDSSFGQAGILSHPLSSPDAVAVSITQPGGDKILIADAETFGEDGLILSRYLPDGMPDHTFGEAGEARAGWGDEIWVLYPQTLAIQADGKILVAGGANSTDEESSSFFLARFHPGGMPDSTFGSGGRILLNTLVSANGLCLQPDGKILVATSTTDALARIARLHENGSLDASFGEGGITAENQLLITGKTVLQQPDGKIILCTQNTLTRFEPNGQKDLSFGDEGTIWIYNDEPVMPVGLSDGKIYVATATSPSMDFQVTCLTYDGQADPGFGDNGQMTYDIWQEDYPTSILPLPDGNIAVAGISDQKLSMLLIQPEGPSITSFGDNGAVTAYFGGYRAIMQGVGWQSAGKIVAAGAAWYGDAVLARYLNDGSLDPTFGQAGKVVTDLKNHQLGPVALALDANDNIFIGGKIDAKNFFVLRYLPDGNLDQAFGENGLMKIAIGQHSCTFRDIAIQPDGKILWTGKVQGNAILGRLLPNGSPDDFFGDGGRISLDDTDLLALAVQPDGKILAGGFDASSFDIFRFLPNGAPDPAFNFIGKANTAMERAYAILLRPNGKILAAGAKNGNPAMVQLLPGGALDPGFQFPNYPGANLAHISDIALLPGGKAMFAGAYNETGEIFLGRVQPNGALDPSLNGGSFIFQHPFSFPYLLAQPDEKIIVASTYQQGSFYLYPPDTELFLARFPADLHTGAVEQSGGFNGLTIAPNPASGAACLSYSLPRAGKVTAILLDAHGRQVHVFLEEAHREAGPQIEELVFPLTLPAGVYWVILKTGGAVLRMGVVLR